MQLPADISLLPVIALYPEIHYRFFRWFPSFLNVNQPEVIFDAPRRLGPGEDLPVTLVVNDLHRFPAELSDCAIAVACNDQSPRRFDFTDTASCEVRHPLRRSLRAFVFRIPRSALPGGHFSVTCRVMVVCGKRKRVVINDNLKGTGKLSFACYAANNSLPGSEYCSYGDLHVHSHYSQSHVEFGPPLAVIGVLARAQGLAFAAITDHSYDLACSIDDYLKSDSNLVRWKTFQEEINAEREDGVVLIPGEEISCLNSKGNVIHLCGVGLKEFIPGTMDGARKNRHREKQLTVGEAVGMIHQQGGIALAAHPGTRTDLLQKMFLSRGQWSVNDLLCGINAMQIFNGGFTSSWRNGKALWINMMQRGLKVPVAAGNDAHGDFNRYRAIAVPFLEISENPGRYMGYARTGIYGRHATASELMAALRRGETFITTGPFAAICSSDSSDASIVGHRPVSSDLREIFLHVISTPEFGHIRSMEVYGDERKQSGLPEKKIFSRNYTDVNYKICERIDLVSLPAKLSYLRAEVRCSSSDVNAGGGQSAAYTSAVYFT